jgi:nicotinate phosphoribosyltransferase
MVLERPSALLTDLYQLTMGQAYRAAGIDDVEACFHLYFRANPFNGGYTLAAGLDQVIEYLSSASFDDDDIAFLAQQTGNDGRPLFSLEYLSWLRQIEFTLDVDGIPEGTAVFPREPLLRVTGPLAQAQLVETSLLNIVNFQSLVATKAARVCDAAQGDPVIEFGLRRAQGPDGGVSASRAAYVGGCAGTSNTLAGRLFGIPVTGTHAHSWVMAFDTELEAFRAYARVMPNNCTFLVDTYDTLEGVRNAIRVGRDLQERGHHMIGIRIDSGDLAWLSKQSRRLLDEAGFQDAKIIASNELDEATIVSLKDQDACIDVWGVGTKLATAYDQPALGGVYKLSAIRRSGEDWTPRVKVSEQTAKMTVPGLLGVRRYRAEDRLDGDMIYDTRRPPGPVPVIVDPEDSTRRKHFGPDGRFEELLVPVIRSGTVVYDRPALSEIRRHSVAELASLDPSVRRFLNPHQYPVGLEEGLHAERMRLVVEARGLEGVEDVAR